MQSLRFTIYELLGYMAPGAIGLAALVILGWTFFYSNKPLVLSRPGLNKEEIFILTFFIYGIGHFIQGVCNIHPSPEQTLEAFSRHRVLIVAARASLAKYCDLDSSTFSVRQISALARAYLVNLGKTDEHDVFVYREGYYRGSSAAFLILGMSLLLRLFRRSTLEFDRRVYEISRSELTCVALGSIAISIIFYRRYLRFSNYRFEHQLAFCCLPPALLGDSGEKGGRNDRISEEPSEAANKEAGE